MNVSVNVFVQRWDSNPRLLAEKRNGFNNQVQQKHKMFAGFSLSDVRISRFAQIEIEKCERFRRLVEQNKQFKDSLLIMGCSS